MRSESGFSLLEMLVAMAVMLTVTAGVFSVLNPTQGDFQTQPEAADMQQRLRVASDTLYKDLVMAGGGSYQGINSGSMLYFFAPVLPYRNGSANDDPPGSFFNDRVTLMYVPDTIAQTTLTGTGPSQVSSELSTNQCSFSSTCGFTTGMVVMIYDDSGAYDTFAVTNVQPVGGTANPRLYLQHNSTKFTYTNYAQNSTKVVQFYSSTYYLKSDDTTQTYQLMHYDGGTAPDVPVVDNVVGLSFKYYGDPQPPQLTGIPLSSATGPWTTYGPKPPALGAVNNSGPAWPAGTNCAFMIDPVSGLQVPRLPVLGPGGTTQTLVELTAAQLTDGPWCPDANNQNRWDVDLLRIRKVGVTIRVQAANAALRGPASVLFTHGGQSMGGNKWLPDQQITFQVTPRNMNLGR